MAKSLDPSDISVVTLSSFAAVSPFDCSTGHHDNNDKSDSGGHDGGHDDHDDPDDGRNC